MTMLRLCTALIRMVSVLVPRPWRQEWRDEWSAELVHRWARLERFRKLSFRTKVDLLVRSLGAIPHALWLWKEQWRLDMLLQDLRYGLRTYLKKPAFTLLAVVTLGVGIGANAIIFSVVNAVLLRPLNIDSPEQVLFIWENNLAKGFKKFTVSPANFLDFREQSHAFETMAAYTRTELTLTGIGEPERIPGAAVSSDFFQMVRVSAALGRTFLSEENEPGKDNVVVLSHGLWVQRFGADPSVLGKALKLDGVPRTVVGVTPPGFRFPLRARLWIPLTFDFDVPASRGAHYLVVLGRLKGDRTIDQAQTELDTITARLQKEYDTDWGARAFPLHNEIVEDARRPLLVLSAAVGFVLLIACANVANLLLARTTARRREIAIRAALGAGRTRIIRQLLGESLMLSALGGLLGLILAYGGLDLLLAVAPTNLPRIEEIAVDGSVLVFTLFVSVATGLVFGTIPALSASRSDVSESLKEGQSLWNLGSRGLSVRNTLVVAEVALALVVVIGAGLLGNSLWRLTKVETGFHADNTVALRLSLPDSRYPEPNQTIDYYERLLDSVGALPGVTATGAASLLPMTGMFNISYQIVGRPLEPGESLDGEMRFVDSGFFQALGVPLLSGRTFAKQDDEQSPLVVVINETLARRTFPGEDPIGQRLDIGYGGRGETQPREIIGIVGDVKEMGMGNEIPPTYYVPFAQTPVRAMFVLARASKDPAGLMGSLRAQVRASDPNLAIRSLQTVEEIVSGSLSSRRLNAGLMSSFALLALALAAVGIYGVIAFTVTVRRREIGLRIALGARHRDVVRLVVGQGLLLAGGGVALGLGASLAVTRLISGLLFGVSATDPLTYLVVSSALMGVACLASLVPARLATRVDPIVTLRTD